MLRPHSQPAASVCLAIPSPPLSKAKPAVGGPLFAWGQDVGPAGFGRCLWNFLQRWGWQESQQRGETVSSVSLGAVLSPRAALSPLSVPHGCTGPSGCPPRLHHPHLVPSKAAPAPLSIPQGSREKGPLPEPPPYRCRVSGPFATLIPRAPGSTAWLPGPAASFEPFPRLGCPPDRAQPATVACRTELQPSTK